MLHQNEELGYTPFYETNWFGRRRIYCVGCGDMFPIDQISIFSENECDECAEESLAYEED